MSENIISVNTLDLNMPFPDIDAQLDKISLSYLSEIYRKKYN